MDNQTIRRIVGENIRVRRVQRGWTQQQLAEAMGVTRQAVSNWECGTVSAPGISLPHLFRFCALLGVRCELFDELKMDGIEDLLKFGNTTAHRAWKALDARGLRMALRRPKLRVVAKND